MLNRRNRIGASEKIEKLAKAGNVFKSDFLLFRYMKMGATGETPSQFAVNVSKRIDNRAVVRNRLRRQINEAIRLHLLSMPKGYSVLVSAKAVTAQKKPEFQKLAQCVQGFINFLKPHAK